MKIFTLNLLLLLILLFNSSLSLASQQSYSAISDLEIYKAIPEKNSEFSTKSNQNKLKPVFNTPKNSANDLDLSWDIMPDVIDTEWISHELNKEQKPTEKEKIFNIRWDIYTRYKK